ncbi:MAG: cytochrome c biogenesis protein CcsA [Coriobacteriaceae bacterium]|jgi:heme exporter protein C|nr:cytochrome c biogenesis protein CcsA [Coriobacteriaceae bacterium]
MSNTKKAVKLPEAGGIFDKIAPIALLTGALLATLGFILTFTIAPLVSGAAVNGVELIGDQMVSNKLLLSQKIFYFHVPVAIASMLALGFTAYYGIRFLMTKEARFDTCAKVVTEVALVFIICTMASGELWTRFEWGVWWAWEPRLTTYLILMLLVIGYFILRNAIDDPERRASYAAVFGIITFVDVPICFMITRMIPSSVHPVVFRTDSGMSPDMLVPFLICFFGMLLIAFALYRLRFRQVRLAERVAALKEQLDD